MVMAETPRPDPAAAADTSRDDEDEAGPEAAPVPALSWVEHETIDALKRLARAQADLAALARHPDATAVPSFDADEAARLEEIHADLALARDKATGRFGRHGARERVDELEMSERLVLDRMGLTSYDAYRAATRTPARVVEPVDPQLLDFAREELAAATQAWLEVQAIADPVPEADAEAEVDPDAAAGSEHESPTGTDPGPSTRSAS
jgi:hypothetical protein